MWSSAVVLLVTTVLFIALLGSLPCVDDLRSLVAPSTSDFVTDIFQEIHSLLTKKVYNIFLFITRLNSAGLAKSFTWIYARPRTQISILTTQNIYYRRGFRGLGF